MRGPGAMAMLTSVIVLFAAAAPASASAETICVPAMVTGCTTSTASLQTALTDAQSNGPNTVKIAAGTYSNGTCSSGGLSGNFTATTTIEGAGEGQTILACPNDYNNSGHYYPILDVSGANAGVTVSGLTIALPAGDGDRGLLLYGVASANDIAVTSNAAGTNGTGVTIEGSGALEDSSVTMPASDEGDLAVETLEGPNTLSGDTLSAADGGGVNASSEGPSQVGTSITGTRVAAYRAVNEQGGTLAIYDSLIDISASGGDGVFAEDTNGPATLGITAGNLTIVTTESNTSGVASYADDSGQHVAVMVSNSVISGATYPLRRTAVSGATANLTADYDDYSAGTYTGSGSGTTTQSNSVTSAPGFVDAAAGDYELAPGSPLIDAGAPGGLATGEPSTDLAGNPRILAGKGNCTARRDIGAFEYDPAALPAPTATVSAASAQTGAKINFSATGCSVDPSLTPSFVWKFDDGATAAGATVTHAFAGAGLHHATVTVSDSAGRTGTATVTVTITAAPRPALSHLRLSPKSFRRAGKTTISYSDSEPATTTLTIERVEPGARRKGKCVALPRHHKGLKRCRRLVVIGHLTHHDSAGTNRIGFDGRLNGHPLGAGAYELSAVARTSSGTSAAVTSGFMVKR